MNELHLAFQERVNTGTTWTKNKSFEDNGYLVIENLWDAAELVCPVPPVKGQFSYWGKKLDQVNHEPCRISGRTDLLLGTGILSTDRFTQSDPNQNWKNKL
jgi:hypothetical protein